jgi:phosphoenolpyruvate carboxykinase (GTP)
VPWPCSETKYIAHFPETARDHLVRSGYGGNALLGQEVLRAAHRLVDGARRGLARRAHAHLELTSPPAKTATSPAAFPSACGKTNLAMLVPTLPGWKVETIGDDIAWMRFNADGELRAINPENGFFGVAPGTGRAPTRTRSPRFTPTASSPTSRSPTTATRGGRA